MLSYNTPFSRSLCEDKISRDVVCRPSCMQCLVYQTKISTLWLVRTCDSQCPKQPTRWSGAPHDLKQLMDRLLQRSTSLPSHKRKFAIVTVENGPIRANVPSPTVGSDAIPLRPFPSWAFATMRLLLIMNVKTVLLNAFISSYFLGKVCKNYDCVSPLQPQLLLAITSSIT